MFFFFNDTATTEIYTLSLHDALPIFAPDRVQVRRVLLHPAPDDLDVVLVPGVVERVGLRHPDDEATLDVGGLGQPELLELTGTLGDEGLVGPVPGVVADADEEARKSVV